MADGAHSPPISAPFRVSVAPAATSLINATPLKNASRRALFAGCAGAVSVAAIVAIASFSVYAIVGKRRGKQPSDSETHSFCCPDEIAKIARYLNTSVNPCDDFFAYVCSSSIELGRYKNTSLDFRLDSAMITRVTPPNVTMLEAGSFLHSSYETCVKTISHRESFATSLASALLQEAGGLLKKVDSRSAMIFNVAASVTYSLHSVIEIYYQGTGSLFMAISAICNPDALSLDCLNATVDALKHATNSTATTMGTAKLAATLCEQVQGRYWQKYNLSNSSSNFSREVWDISDVNAAINALGLPLDGGYITVVGGRNIHLLYDIFANYTSADTMAAYLLWHAVVRGIKQFEISGTQFLPQVAETCTGNALQLYELRELFKAEILTTPDKDVEVTNICTLIKKAVHEHFKRIPFIKSKDAEKRDRFFENMRFVTPMAETRASVSVPKATQNFAQNLLKGRRFNLEVYVARRSKFVLERTSGDYGDLSVLGDSLILPSPMVYDAIRTGPNSFLPNMAILGQSFAESLWRLAVDLVMSKRNTKDNFENFTACFDDAYINNAKLSRRDNVLYISLAMSTVLTALNVTNWHTVQHAWSLWTLSHAQFFYILNSYHRCPDQKSLQAYLEISVPLMYAQDFAQAFSCSTNASTIKPRQCLDLGQHRT